MAARLLCVCVCRERSTGGGGQIAWNTHGSRSGGKAARGRLRWLAFIGIHTRASDTCFVLTRRHRRRRLHDRLYKTKCAREKLLLIDRSTRIFGENNPRERSRDRATTSSRRIFVERTGRSVCCCLFRLPTRDREFVVANAFFARRRGPFVFFFFYSTRHFVSEYPIHMKTHSSVFVCTRRGVCVL